MKKTLYIALILMLGYAAQAWGQASTEGQEFWVSSTICTMPPPSKGSPTATVPYIAISAQDACTVHITNVTGTVNITANLAAGSWTEFSPTSTPALTANQWYPDQIMRSDDVKSLANQTNNYGLHITATKNISVYVILRADASMDASNILPLTAIQSEYMITDYQPEAHGTTYQPVSMATILATEDNTKIDIFPTSTPAGKANVNMFTITLNKGQTYYLMSQDGQQLSGTRIKSRKDPGTNKEKKIAVFQGSAITRIPNGVSARDCIFEQAMPIDYWGTRFVVTRSMHKDGNFVGITATENGTEVKFDGYPVTYLNEGETYYICMQGSNDPNAKKAGSHPLPAAQVLTTDVIYIETSCPCAVVSYDTGNGFINSSNSHENLKSGDDALGDPSSVWISPIEQKINRITFGACYTNRTLDHYLNIVANTATCQQTTLTAYLNSTPANWTNRIQWTQVPGNPTYSYARVKIGDNTPNIKIFTLDNPAGGFIAHIYGNGDDESYAYSAGSAAVKRAINIDGMNFTDGYTYDKQFCLGVEMLFDAQVGTDIIDKVDWDFGDGITLTNGSVQMQHTYVSPGWYDASATIYAHKECPDTVYPGERVSFSFYVNRPDTVKDTRHECVDRDPNNPDAPLPSNKYDTLKVDCDTVKIFTIEYGYNSTYSFDTIAQDEFNFHGKKYEVSGDYSVTLPRANAEGCDSIINFHVRVLTCLALDKKNENPVEFSCETPNILTVPADYIKGDIGHTYYIYKGDTIDLKLEGEAPDYYWTMPIEQLTPDNYKMPIYVEDTLCGKTLSFTITFTKQFPAEQAFRYKFNNVLALYNADHNGGYNFVSYQWYIHHSDEPEGIFKPIPGATNWMYTVEGTFTVGDQYYVRLKLANGTIIDTCPFEIKTIDIGITEGGGTIGGGDGGGTIGGGGIIGGGGYKKVPAAKKQIENGQIRIYRDNASYNIYGVRIR